MKNQQALPIIGPGLLGAFSAWALPVDWFPYVFSISIGITLLVGVAATIGANEEPKLSKSVQFLSLLSLGTTRPNATLAPGLPLRLFQIAASFVIGLAAYVIIISNF